MHAFVSRSPVEVLLDLERSLLSSDPATATGSGWGTPRPSRGGSLHESRKGFGEAGYPRTGPNALVKLVHEAPGALRPQELLHLLLVLPGAEPARMETLAERLLERFGSLGAVLAAPPESLRGLGDMPSGAVDLLKAIQVTLEAVLREPLRERPLISSWSQLLDYLRTALRHAVKEEARALYLDRKNHLIHEAVLGRGTVDHTPLYPREIVQGCLERGASAVILVHNHPSGDPTPSQGDIQMTRAVKAALATIDVELHDHVIVGAGRYHSMRSAGLV